MRLRLFVKKMERCVNPVLRGQGVAGKMMEVVAYFGIVSGKKEDKFAKTGLTPVKSDFVDAPYIREFPFNLECKIIQVIEIGLHTQFIGEIMDVKIDDTLQENGDQPIIEQIQPLIYAPDSRNYYSIGKQIASAFSIGNEIGK